MSFQGTNNQTDNINVQFTDLQRRIAQDVAARALTKYEGDTFIVPSRNMIEWVDVTETTDPTQG
jgi:hypothetical protein